PYEKPPGTTIASTPCRSRSPCHRITASPTRSHASCASTSSHVPGKRRTPNRTASGLDDLVILDQRVREQLLAHRRKLREVGDVQLDQPPDVDVPHALEAERRQRPLDRLSLRIEDAGLRAHEHAHPPAHGAVRSSHAPNGSPVISSYASTYFSRVRATTSSGIAGAGGRLSQPVSAAQSRTYCLSKLGCPRPTP